MELKPVITNFGDERLYSHLSPEIERRLPQTFVEWERSLGATKNVFLQASFVKFNPSNLVSTADTRANISKQPFLHLYWTGCLEFDEYKSGLKDSILNWLKHLKEKGIKNWLVIQVYAQDGSRSSKSKLTLPRGSVFDKIRTELCNKDQDRCIQLWEPAKETLYSRSGESWQALLRLVRQLLLSTIEQHLRRFEHKNRNFRECYAQPDWSFTRYFILHEELALILKSVTLHEDALVKYDELDALLSQFIINSKGRDHPIWLRQFKEEIASWDGISLNKEKVKQRRDLVYEGKASILDLRNYLFARQCQLLNKHGKTNEIAKRLHELIYAVRKELEILKAPLPAGAFGCWVSLTCLYFLQYFEVKRPSDKVTLTYLSQTTDYGRQKVIYLGDLCQLTSIDGNEVSEGIRTRLLEGLPSLDPQRKEADTDLPGRLIDSLTSKKSFSELYVDLCQRTEKLLTSVGNLRFAMKVRIDLARFYILVGEYDLAEGLLKPAVQTYKEQKWSVLHADVLTLLARCHVARNELDSYLSSLPMLSCASSISEEQRKSFTLEFLNLSQDSSRNAPTLDCEPVLNVLNVKIKLFGEKGHVGDMANVEVTLRNNFLDDIPCQEICIGLKYSPISFDALSPRERKRSPHRSPGHPHFDQFELVYDVDQETPEKSSEFSFNSKLRHSLFRRNHMTRTQILQKGLDSTDSPEPPKEKSKPPPLLLDPWVKDLEVNGTSASGGKLSNSKPSLLKLSKSDPSLKRFVDADADSLGSPKNSGQKLSRPFSEDSRTQVMSSNGDTTPKRQVNSGSRATKLFEDMDSINDSNDVSSLKRSYMLSQSPSEDNRGTESDIDTKDGQTQNADCTSMDSGLETMGDNSSSEKSLVPTSIPTEIEEEVHVEPVEKLSCSNVVLSPGLNTVNVSAKILHEGRYALRSLTCKTGVVLFYQWLGLKRRSRAFFMVVDPPKFKWTSKHLADILLVGSKQRLRISIANGPGVIGENAVVRLTSSTGLLFHRVPWSSVQLHPALSKNNTREGAMKIDVVEPYGAEVGHVAHFFLPQSDPHESMNAYIDVTAPVDSERTLTHMVQHEIQVEYLWLSEFQSTRSSLISVFYEPFAVEHKLITCNERRFVQIALRGLNPVWLILTKASLGCENCDCLRLQENFKNVEKSLNGEEEFYYVWELLRKGDADHPEPTTLQFHFQVEYLIKDDEESNAGVYNTTVELENLKAYLFLDLIFEDNENESYPVKGKPTRTTIQLRSSSTDTLVENYGGKLFISFENDEFWTFPEPTKTLEFDIRGHNISTFKVTTQALNSGWVPYPIPTIMYYTTEESKSPPSDPDGIDEDEVWMKRKERGSTSKQRTSHLQSSRRTSSTLSDSLLVEFDRDIVVCAKSGASIWVDEMEFYTTAL